MQINYLGQDKFSIKSKNARIELKNFVDIEDFVINGPGEYERKNVFVEGIGKDSDQTVYVIRAEDLSLCYLGKLKRLLSDEEIKRIGDIDILFVPLGEEGTLEISKANEVIVKIDPRVVIPMLYSDLAKFKEIEGVSNGEVETYKVKKIDLPSEERNIVIIKPKS